MSSAVYIDSIQICGASIHTLASQKEELEYEIKDLEMGLVALAAGPRDPVLDSEGNPIQWHEYLPHEVKSRLEDYANAVIKLSYINTALENPEDISDDTADQGKKERERLIRIQKARYDFEDAPHVLAGPATARPAKVRDEDEGNSHG